MPFHVLFIVKDADDFNAVAVVAEIDRMGAARMFQIASTNLNHSPPPRARGQGSERSN